MPITVLTQNARVASFFVRLADLSGHTDYRKLAYWALRSSPMPIASMKPLPPPASAMPWRRSFQRYPCTSPLQAPLVRLTSWRWHVAA